MNFTRIIGQNDKIYRKFGDYCMAEENNECFILCSMCQEEHICEDQFWAHVREIHNYVPPILKSMYETQVGHHIPIPQQHQMDEEQLEDQHQVEELEEPKQESYGHLIMPPPSKKRKMQRSRPNSPMYVAAEYLEGVELNDAEAMLELDEVAAALFGVKSEAKQKTVKREYDIVDEELEPIENAEGYSESVECGKPSLYAAVAKATNYIDIDKVGSKHLLNGKVLKRLFQQMQRCNREFKYKLNRLSQELKIIDKELKRDPAEVRNSRHMKIIPEKPLSTRDEVLILDEELANSKNMRDSLHDEALMVMADSADIYCRVLWRLIMTDEVSNQFCWRGVSDGPKIIKYPIKDMTLMDVLQAAFREKFPSQPINYFKDRTMTYFNKAFERMKRNRLLRLGKSGDSLDDDSTLAPKILLRKRLRKYEMDDNTTREEDDEDDAFEEIYC